MPKLSTFSENNKEKNTISKQSVKEIYDKYKDMQGSELASTLTGEVERQKSAGSFDYDKLCLMIEGMKGYLPPETYENVKRIMQSLK